jgi:Domain of unknown function (DUF5655)
VTDVAPVMVNWLWPCGYAGHMDPSDWTVEDHLRGKPAAVVRLYERFVELIQACGPFNYAVSKTAITFKGSRRGFAGAKPKTGSLDGYLDLQRRVEDPRIRSAGAYTKRLFVHQFRVSTPEQLDDEFAGWVREAYAVGQGSHLQRPPGA